MEILKLGIGVTMTVVLLGIAGARLLFLYRVGASAQPVEPGRFARRRIRRRRVGDRLEQPDPGRDGHGGHPLRIRRAAEDLAEHVGPQATVGRRRQQPLRHPPRDAADEPLVAEHAGLGQHVALTPRGRQRE